MGASGLIAAIAAAFAVPVAAYMARLMILAFESRTHVTLTENQRQTIIDSSKTAAGEIVVALAKGRTTLAEVSPNGALLKERAAVAVNAAPGAALVMGVDNADMARLVTGQVGQMLAADPTTPVLPAPVIPLASKSPEDVLGVTGFMDASVRAGPPRT